MQREEVVGLFNECRQELIDLGYDLPSVAVNLDYNSVSVMGVCQKKVGSDFFLIKISKFHWQNNESKEVRNTIMHELTHAIDRNKHSHDHVWMRLAQEVSLKTGVQIKMYASTTEGEEKASIERAVAYVNCNTCGHRHYIYRRTKVYRQKAEGYNCSTCGPRSKLTFVKLK
jgi:predicted SprT family Zn-dependent metalloprotease